MGLMEISLCTLQVLHIRNVGRFGGQQKQSSDALLHPSGPRNSNAIVFGIA